MAGIGEASAVAATIQIGVSLTKTLVAVVSDYRSAREDINNIATEVNATLKQAEELDHIVADNVRTKRLNHRGLQLALKCKTDSERIVQKLIKLLTKAEVPGDELYTFKVEDIEVSKFRSAAWHFWKPKLEVIKRELDSIRIQILLAHIYISAKSAPGENERAALENLVPGLQRSRRLAHRLVREAQARSNKAEQSDMSNRGVEPHPAPVSSGLSFPPSHVNHRVERSSKSSFSNPSAPESLYISQPSPWSSRPAITGASPYSHYPPSRNNRVTFDISSYNSGQGRALTHRQTSSLSADTRKTLERKARRYSDGSHNNSTSSGSGSNSSHETASDTGESFDDMLDKYIDSEAPASHSRSKTRRHTSPVKTGDDSPEYTLQESDTSEGPAPSSEPPQAPFAEDFTSDDDKQGKGKGIGKSTESNGNAGTSKITGRWL